MIYKKYDLVISPSLPGLIETVNEAISVGYYPKGGMLAVEGKYVQTIYLRDKEPEAAPAAVPEDAKTNPA